MTKAIELSQLGSLLKTDEASGFLGVGTNSPSAPLHVSGDAVVTDDVIVGDEIRNNTPSDFWSSDNTFISLNGLGNLTHMGSFQTVLTSNGYRTSTSAQWKSLGANGSTGAAQIVLDPTGYIRFGTESNKADGSSHVVTPRVMIDSDGSVGVGTNSPKSTLDIISPQFDISGNLNATTTAQNSGLTLQYDGGDATGDAGAGIKFAQRWFGGSTHNVVTAGIFGYKRNSGGNFGGGLKIATSNGTASNLATRLTINDGGLVGINIESPQLRLDVVGSDSKVAVFRPDNSQTSAYGDSSAVNNLINLRMPYGSNAGTTSNSGARWGIQFTGRNDASGYGNDVQKSAAIYGISEDTLGYNRKVGLALYTSSFDANQEERLRISSTGKVGIGIATPFSDLQVGGHTFTGGNGMYTNTRVGISNHGALTGLMLASTYNDPTHPEYGLVFVQGPSGTNYNVWSVSPQGPALGTGLEFIYEANSTNIHTISPKVIFKGDGNVGIGTNNPVQKLHVEGTIRATKYVGDGSTTSSTLFGHVTDSTNPSVVTWGKDHATYPGQVHIVARSDNASAQSGKIKFYDYHGSGWTENMVITKEGNVGIGGDPTGGDGGNAAYNNWSTPKFYIQGPGTTGKFNLLARFRAGGDADNTGAQIVINHENDRGMALQGGRSSSNRSYGAIMSLDNLARECKVMDFQGGSGAGIDHIKFYTGTVNATDTRVKIDSGGDFYINNKDYPLITPNGVDMNEVYAASTAAARNYGGWVYLGSTQHSNPYPRKVFKIAKPTTSSGTFVYQVWFNGDANYDYGGLYEIRINNWSESNRFTSVAVTCINGDSDGLRIYAYNTSDGIWVTTNSIWGGLYIRKFGYDDGRRSHGSSNCAVDNNGALAVADVNGTSGTIPTGYTEVHASDSGGGGYDIENNHRFGTGSNA